jgi:hypothetical protein
MHLLNLSPRNPQRSPEGHSASFVQVNDGCEALSSVVWTKPVLSTSSGLGCALLHATRHRVRASNGSLDNDECPPTGNSEENATRPMCNPISCKMLTQPVIVDSGGLGSERPASNDCYWGENSMPRTPAPGRLEPVGLRPLSSAAPERSRGHPTGTQV